MNTRSLRFQLLAWYTSLLVVAFTAVGFFLFVAVKQLLLQNLRELLSKRARQIAHITTQTDEALTAAWLRGQIATLYAPETPESNGRFVRVATDTGQILFQSGMPADGSFDPAAIPLLAYKEEGFRFHRAGDQEILIRSARGNPPSGPVIVEVGAATAPVEASAHQLFVALSVTAPCLVAIAAVGAYFLIGRALQPVVRLTQSAEAISAQNLGNKLPVLQTGDELQTLSLALDRMIMRIHDAVENTRRFVADASHELRTPLAVLRGELENVSNKKDLPGEVRDTLASNLEEVDRLSKIVQGLLALSRLDCGEAQAESVVFDLSKVAATTSEQMCLLAEDKNVSFRWDAPTPVFVRGDPARIKQVIVNLVDNAINYTPAGGKVNVRAFAENSHAVFEVADTGVGIPEASIARVFERFYRVDKARSRDVGGAGLGLSIVRSICQAHGAEIKVQSAPGKGSCFQVFLPRAGEMPSERRA